MIICKNPIRSRFVRYLFVCATTSLICYLRYNTQRQELDRQPWKPPPTTIPKHAKMSKKQQVRTILLWNGFSTEDENENTFKQCAFSNCALTANRELLNASRAVLFHTFRLDKFIEDLPTASHEWQDWILYTREPPYEIRALDHFRDKFTILIHHRRDADITSGYGYFEKLSKKELIRSRTKPTINHAENKTGLVSWIVSNCKAPSKRNLYVKELMKYIPVDVFGRCSNKLIGTHRHDVGYEYLKRIKEYKFYLAFENQICRDYITEKVWNPLRLGTIPVVLGGTNYKEYLVDNSYIDVRDFPSPKSLANHIRRLDVEDREYNEYFEWRKTYEVREDFSIWCRLCERLNVHDKPMKRYSNVNHWFDKCTEPKYYYKGVADKIMHSYAEEPFF